jgi:hypothetical protein
VVLANLSPTNPRRIAIHFESKRRPAEAPDLNQVQPKNEINKPELNTGPSSTTIRVAMSRSLSEIQQAQKSSSLTHGPHLTGEL